MEEILKEMNDRLIRIENKLNEIKIYSFRRDIESIQQVREQMEKTIKDHNAEPIGGADTY